MTHVFCSMNVVLTANRFFFISVHFLRKCAYLFLAVLGLHCCMWAFSSGEWGLLFDGVFRFLIAVPSIVAEHRLLGHGFDNEQIFGPLFLILHLLIP